MRGIIQSPTFCINDGPGIVDCGYASIVIYVRIKTSVSILIHDTLWYLRGICQSAYACFIGGWGDSASYEGSYENRYVI